MIPIRGPLVAKAGPESIVFPGIYGEGQNRTGDTTIFSQGNGSDDLAVVAGTFLIGSADELPLVSCGFP
jgi:hypothetical protein